MNHLEICWPMTCSAEEIFAKESKEYINIRNQPAVLLGVLGDSDKEFVNKCSWHMLV